MLVNLLDRRRRLLTDNIDALHEATRLTQMRRRFAIDAMVVLPDHIHAVWTLPPGNADFFVALAADQNRLRQSHFQGRAAKRGAHCARRTRASGSVGSGNT
jgi:putative transposase